MTLTPQDARKLEGIAGALASSDPDLARSLSRFTAPAHTRGRFGVGIAILLVSGSGLVPLVLGLALQTMWLTVAGVLLAVPLPVAGPLLVLAAVRGRTNRRPRAGGGEEP